MKREMDLIRELLLKLEALPMRAGGILLIKADDQEVQVEGYDANQIDYHLSLMKKSGWIDTGGVNPMVGMGFRGLTPAGHDLLDSLNNPKPQLTSSKDPAMISRRVFVVHGHDEGAKEGVARFLERLDFLPVILHEQANQGRTVIEKIEAHGDVHFAVVLLTPDDTGCVKGGEPEPRARQNVLLELGYFIGRLGRDKVCALKRGEVEIPSDFAGVVWEKMDDGGGWKQALGRELQAAGHEVDWNMVMRL